MPGTKDGVLQRCVNPTFDKEQLGFSRYSMSAWTILEAYLDRFFESTFSTHCAADLPARFSSFPLREATDHDISSKKIQERLFFAHRLSI